VQLWSAVWAKDSSYTVPWVWTEYCLWKHVYGCTPVELEVILAKYDWDDIQEDMVCYNFDQQRQNRK